MTIDATKIDWCGSKCILLTERENGAKPIAIIRDYDLRQLWKLMLEMSNMGELS